MARNEEKAQSMLYRFRQAQQAELGLAPKKPLMRPRNPLRFESVKTCERWRLHCVKEIGGCVAKINDASLDDSAIRELNDKINNLLEEKDRWEARIKQLGGTDYSAVAPPVSDEAVSINGYRYFGRAKELPGVKELWSAEREAAETVRKARAEEKTREELVQVLDATYFGLRDEEDGTLLQQETNTQKRLKKQFMDRLVKTADTISGESMDDSATQKETGQVQSRYIHEFLPTKRQFEERILELKKIQLLKELGMDTE